MSWTLVTGGAGFIGLCIVERLLTDGANVVVFDTKSLPDRARRAFDALPGRLRFIKGDVCSHSSLALAFTEPVSDIVHAAAITAGPQREVDSPDSIVAVNVGGIANLALAAARHDVHRMLLVSSAAVYGTPGPQVTELTEESTLTPYTLYETTKYAGELLLRRLADLHSIDLCIVRLGWVYGPWEHQSGARDTMSAIHQMAVAALDGAPVVLPRTDRREWSYAPDVAIAIAKLLRTANHRWPLYNINAGVRIDLLLWAEWLHSSTGPFDAARPTEIELHGSDGVPFRADRLRAEFPIAWRSPREAFLDYMAWLRSDPWPLQEVDG